MRIGIIGYGTVGGALANILKDANILFSVYDVKLEDSYAKELIIEKAKFYNVTIKNRLVNLIESSDYIISTVTTDEAEKIAKECLRYLHEYQIYIDLNSTSSEIKKRISNLIESRGASFVEGTILNSVKLDSKTFNILLTGDKGPEIESFFKELGIDCKFYSNEIGKASDFKMIRSIFSKGLENLIIETLLTANKAGIEKDLWDEIVKFMDSKSFNDIAEAWVTSHVFSCERRLHEMNQVLETMNNFGVEPIMSKATSSFFERSVNINIKGNTTRQPDSIESTIETVNNALSRRKSS